jgi:hypothetical protein
VQVELLKRSCKSHALNGRDLQKMSGITSVHVGDLNASQV